VSPHRGHRGPPRHLVSAASSAATQGGVPPRSAASRVGVEPGDVGRLAGGGRSGAVGVGEQQVADVEVDVPAGPLVDVDVDEASAPPAGATAVEPALLGGLAHGRLGHGLARVDVPARLQPDADPLVPVEQHPAVPSSTIADPVTWVGSAVSSSGAGSQSSSDGCVRSDVLALVTGRPVGGERQSELGHGADLRWSEGTPAVTSARHRRAARERAAGAADLAGRGPRELVDDPDELRDLRPRHPRDERLRGARRRRAGAGPRRRPRRRAARPSRRRGPRTRPPRRRPAARGAPARPRRGRR
jgi:hypothetical protein